MVPPSKNRLEGKRKLKVTVRFFTILRELTGKREEKLEFSGSVALKDLLKCLSDKYGRPFDDYVYDEGGNVRNYIQVLVNGKNVKIPQDFETELEEGATVAILPPVGGG